MLQHVAKTISYEIEWNYMYLELERDGTLLLMSETGILNGYKYLK